MTFAQSLLLFGALCGAFGAVTVLLMQQLFRLRDKARDAKWRGKL